MRRVSCLLAAVGAWVACLAITSVCWAHAFDPVLVDLKPSEISSSSGHSWEVTWTLAADIDARLGERARLARPGLAPGCEGGALERRDLADTIVTTWTIRCDGDGWPALELGDLVPMDNALLVRVRSADGTVEAAHALDPPHRFVPGAVESATESATLGAFLWIGVEHILLGPDHLLFVLCLLFLVGSKRALLGVVTAFTISHSLTLALAVYDVVSLPGPPVEAMIALSIVLLAAEAVRARRADSSDAPTLTQRHPASVAFVFGLVHGLGFAGALESLALPAAGLGWALAGFNLGVELGQVFFVAVALGVAALVRRASEPPRWLAVGPLYGAGVIGVAWLIERVSGFAA